MEHALRAALIEWLRTAPAPLNALNMVEEEAPLRAAPPWLGIAASASADWSTKDRAGREIRLALELRTRGDDPAADGALVTALDRRVEDLPRQQPEFAIASTFFLRARAERRANNRRSMLLEYRFRCLANQSRSP
ncbi:tail completion protein gp17 [Pelagerythrobacter marensis]|uniref:DUF3168 domain-containing protein n=1 Tax=Pelagerythrobacter marensis TaxID=543877 RepID=A0A0G3X9B7_9SPHN|nr:DUF3168 domain-containing protein [Pelagerythrobacter marensis]AKM08120.1 hypothetical protein AM2010_2058 [Pelagerythrobacter marensis]